MKNLLKIKKITKIDKMDRYDLTINKTHNFYANGVLIHNTSGRYSYSNFNLVLPKWKKGINKILPIFKETGWDYVAGSRRVDFTETEIDKNKEGYHGSNQYRYDILDILKPYLSKGLVIYLEILGWVNDKPIMGKHDITKLKDKEMLKKYGREIIYSYGNAVGEHSFKIYRISQVQEDGSELDYTWRQIREFCETRDLPCALQIHPQFIFDGDFDKLDELVENLTERPECLGEDFEDSRHVSEGIVIRVDNGNPKPLLLKNKNFSFKVMEGIAKENVIDIEDAS